jgi:hypothetical protein
VKSYGRAPTFLMATGFEQVRSVVAAIAGDLEAADRVELDLPETGVCGIGVTLSDGTGSQAGEADCCGGPPKADAAACCALDETAKAQGASGCGCGDSGVDSSAPPRAAGRCGAPAPASKPKAGCCG